MKTYLKTIRVPQLEIKYQEGAENPRNYMDCLGYFYTAEARHISPDGNDSIIYNIMKETGDEATSTQNHIELMTKRINDEAGEKVIAIYPVNRYEHGNVRYSLGERHGFDYSNSGFYIVTENTQKKLGTLEKDFEKVIAMELDEYTKWANGEVYEYTLYKENGEVDDSGSGFYSLQEVKDNLGSDWENEDMEQYLINNY